jgi:hypothetical protein
VRATNGAQKSSFYDPKILVFVPFKKKEAFIFAFSAYPGSYPTTPAPQK